MIREYIAYYNFSRLQRRLGVHTPMEVHNRLLAA
ncbi:IS3 family transposase [Intestinimonas butyriciproducens]